MLAVIKALFLQDAKVNEFLRQFYRILIRMNQIILNLLPEYTFINPALRVVGDHMRQQGKLYRDFKVYLPMMSPIPSSL